LRSRHCLRVERRTDGLSDKEVRKIGYFTRS
jgi:hypothetical protein